MIIIIVIMIDDDKDDHDDGVDDDDSNNKNNYSGTESRKCRFFLHCIHCSVNCLQHALWIGKVHYMTDNCAAHQQGLVLRRDRFPQYLGVTVALLQTLPFCNTQIVI